MSIRIRPLEPIPITSILQELATSLINRITRFLTPKTARNPQNYSQHDVYPFFLEDRIFLPPMPFRPFKPLQDNNYE